MQHGWNKFYITKVWDEVYQARMSVVYQQLYPDTVQELSGTEEELPKDNGAISHVTISSDQGNHCR